VETYSPETLVSEIVNHFASRRVRRVPVVEDGMVIGIISRRDILIELDRIYSRLVAKEEE